MVDFLMKWIGRTLHEKSDVYIYPTRYYTFLKADKGSLERVSSWKTCDPFDKHILLLPICYGNHWTLAVVLNAGAVSNPTDIRNGPTDINGPVTCVVFFDSMRLAEGCHERHLDIYSNILTWLNNMWKEKEENEEKEGRSIGSNKVFTKETCKMHTPNGTWLSNCCFNVQTFMIYSSRSITKIPLFIHSSSTRQWVGLWSIFIFICIECDKI